MVAIDRKKCVSEFEADIVCEETTEVSKVGQLLKGKRVVMIGGSCRLNAKLGLERAFGLKGLDWVEGHGLRRTSEAYESHIARPDVAVVLLATRWVRHAFHGAKKVCDKHGKPFVRVPGGYNPNQIAHQVLIQCGDRLAGRK